MPSTHLAAVAILDAGPLRRSDGRLDVARIERRLEAALPRCPRLRQRIARIPGFGSPVWIDDPRFSLPYHLRHTALPYPGDQRQLKRLAGRILSQQLDGGKPLWELWLIEGLERDAFALLLKIHRSLGEGAGGMDLLAALLSADPNAPEPGPGHWIPRPAPGSLALLAGELWRRAATPLDELRAAGATLASAGGGLGAVLHAVQRVGEAVTQGLGAAPATPLNLEIGPHRRCDWTRFELAAAEEAQRALGGNLDDLVLSVAAGALGRFLEGRGERVAALPLRALVTPVAPDRSLQEAAQGDVTSFVIALPIAERDPRRRLERVASATRQSARLAFGEQAYHVAIAVVEAPPLPAYLVGARMRALYPLPPLRKNQGVAIAVFRYDGGLHWGLSADWDALPDLHDLVRALELEFEALCRAASKGGLRHDDRGDGGLRPT